MDIKLNQNERLRVDSGCSDTSNFIDVSKAGYSGLCTTLFSGFQYIEIRKKSGLLRVYTFPKKSHKKEHDFKGWEDAEVVFSQNEQVMHR